MVRCPSYRKRTETDPTARSCSEGASSNPGTRTVFDPIQETSMRGPPQTERTFPDTFDTESPAAINETCVLKPVVAPQDRRNRYATFERTGEGNARTLSFPQGSEEQTTIATVARSSISEFRAVGLIGRLTNGAERPRAAQPAGSVSFTIRSIRYLGDSYATMR